MAKSDDPGFIDGTAELKRQLDEAAQRPQLSALPPLGEGVHDGVPHVRYHNDPCAEPSLSRSLAAVLLERSAFHAWQAHPRLGGGLEPDDTESSDRGSIVHELLLEVGPGFVACPFKDWRTKAAQAARDAARAEGKIPILADRLDACRTTADRVRQHFPIFGPGARKEVVVVWRQEGVLCRARFDVLLIDDVAYIFDVKSCDNAAVASSERNVVTMGNHFQGAVYIEGVEHALPEFAGRTQFVMIFAEVRKPYDCMERELSGELLEAGRGDWRYAVREWGAALRANKWPGYGKERKRIAAPGWFGAAQAEKMIARMSAQKADGGDIPF